MVAVHILIFGEMAGFKIVPFIATHVKMKNFFHGAMKKFFQPIRTRQFAGKQLILNYFCMTDKYHNFSPYYYLLLLTLCLSWVSPVLG